MGNVGLFHLLSCFITVSAHSSLRLFHLFNQPVRDTGVAQRTHPLVVAAFATHPDACGLAARYYHPLVEDDAVSRAMLGYEIYMRLYVLNLWRIG